MSKKFLETIKILDGEIYNLPYHQKRYEGVLKALGAEETQQLQEFIKPPEWGLYRCRVVYSATDIEVSFHEYKKREIETFKLIFENDIEYAHKSADRNSIDALYEKKEDADEILIIKDLMVTDTSIANIAFLTEEGSWITPKNPLLKGTTRARLLDEGKIREADIKVHELRSFSKVALLNAMIDFDILDRCEFLI
ncbi:MAG: aminotransferase class IV family protein [Campylobacterota bacterium]|nr:aminotransferase class IV family protein [Campylobacterota bacterium]